MGLSTLFYTVRYLKPIQLFYQCLYRIYKPKLKIFSPINAQILEIKPLIPKDECYSNGYFTFLNRKSPFVTWNDASFGSLWCYNLNYMDWLLQPGLTFNEAADWIDRFIGDIFDNRIGLDAYPIALRGINWIKFISLHHAKIDSGKLSRWNESLYSQYKLLERKLEYHLLGNHLLEDAYSLYIAAIYFFDLHFYKKSKTLLRRELEEQVLPDGAHYELSPMYHCVLLERLLDCYNISIHNVRFDRQQDFNEILSMYARKMLGHLDSIIYENDHSIPLFNDSARRIAPKPDAIFDYAVRLGITWKPLPMNVCGYRRLKNDFFEVLLDVGNVVASYQPGHSHSDTFSYELRLKGKPFISDTGISTYEKNGRRQYERGTSAHNTVTVKDMNSSDVWSGFRVGKRAKVKLLSEAGNRIIAIHDGFGRKCLHKRTFCLDVSTFEIADVLFIDTVGKNYIHFAPGTEILAYNKSCIETRQALIKMEGASEVVIMDESLSEEYNKCIPIKTACIYFKREMSYKVVLRNH